MNNTVAKRYVGSIDVLKFLLAVSIVVLHTGQSFGGDSYYLKMAGVAVELFFIISGCLLCMSAFRDAQRSTRGLGEDTVRFLWRKVKGLLVPYLVIVLVYVVTWCASTGADLLESSGVASMLGRALFFVPNVLFLSLSGILSDSIIIGITWYVSAMLIAMLVTYPLVRKFGRSYTLIVAPFLAIMLLGFMYNEADGLYKGIYEWRTFMPQGLMRAFIGINLGCVAYEISNKLRSLDLTALSRALLLVFVVLFGVALVLFMQYGSEKGCYCMVVLFPLLIGVMFSQQMVGDALFNNAVCAYLGRASIYIYLYHAAIRRVVTMSSLEPTYLQAFAILFVGAFALYALTDLVERLVRKRFAAHDIKVSRLFVNQG